MSEEEQIILLLKALQDLAIAAMLESLESSDQESTACSLMSKGD